MWNRVTTWVVFVFDPILRFTANHTSALKSLPLAIQKPKSMSISKFGRSLPFSGIFRKLEQDVETVIRVLQPGPVGIVEHKFSDEEIREANATVRSAVENWRRRAKSEAAANSVLREFIDI